MNIRLVINGKYDVTRLISEAVWQGSAEAAARTLTVSLAPGAAPESGDKAAFYVNGRRLFYGMVTFSERTERSTTISAADYGMYLARNETYREYAGTPQAVFARIAAEFGLAAGDSAKKKKSVVVTSTGDLTAWDVIRAAYAIDERRPGYVIRVDGKKAWMERAGTVSAGKLSAEIESSSSADSVGDMIDRVTMISTRGARLGAVSDAAARKKYGTFGVNYHEKKGVNSRSAAQELLIGRLRGGTVKTAGNTALICGRSVGITDSRTGLCGKYTIISDRHIFAPSGYETELEFYE